MLQHRPTFSNVLVFSLVFAALLAGMGGILRMEALALPQFAAGMFTGVWSLWGASLALDMFACWRKRRAECRDNASSLD